MRRRADSVVRVLVFACVLLSVVVTPASASGALALRDAPDSEFVSQTGEPESTPGVSIAVSRPDATTLVVNATYAVPAAVRDLHVIVGTGEVRGTNGFERCDSNRLCWDTSTKSPTVTIRYDLTPYVGTYAGIVSNETVFVPAPRIYTVWRTGDERRTAPLTARREYESYNVRGEKAVVANATLFFGAHAEYDHTTENGTTFRLIVPRKVRLGPSRARLFDTLSRASRALDVGGHNREVIAVALGATSQSTEFGIAGATVGNAFWARSGSSLSSTHDVWLHEYVHTRQRFADRGREMEWFVEASAEYYAARLAYELGLVSAVEYEWEMKSREASAGNSVLADPVTWTEPSVPYRKGALVLAALDAEIKDRTNGNRSLEDVFRELNRADRTLTYPVFVETVVEVSADPSMETWLDRFVRGPDVPEYESRDPEERLPDPPQVDEVRGLVPTTPFGFAVAAVGLALVSMLVVGVLSFVTRSLGRFVEGVFRLLDWLANVLSGRR